MYSFCREKLKKIGIGEIHFQQGKHSGGKTLDNITPRRNSEKANVKNERTFIQLETEKLIAQLA